MIIEGWAQSTPVVAAESAGPKALIEPGENGLLAPLEDSAALAEQINGLLTDPTLRQSLAAAGRAEYEASYTEDAVVGRYQAFFEKVTR